MLDQKTAALLDVTALDSGQFAVFGEVISADPAKMRLINDGTTERYHRLATVETCGNQRSVLLNIFRGHPFSVPIDITMVERHPYGSQAFVPLGNRPFLVVVAEDNDGVPGKPQAFLATPGQGVNYRRNTWHHPLLALHETSDFLVVDCGGGKENNLEEYFYETPYRIARLGTTDALAGEGKAQRLQKKPFTIAQLNTADDETFCRALANVFEHSPWIARQILNRRPFASIKELCDSMTNVVLNAAQEEQLTLIRSHPDLAGKAARAGAITQESEQEQRSAGLDRLNEEEFAEFHKLNKNYKEHFGFPYIIAVRGFDAPHDKKSILHDIRIRLSHAAADEIQEALRQIARIAELRLTDLLGE